MNKLIVVLLVGLSLLTGCGEKVYSADAVYKEYQAEGEKSALYQELEAACDKDFDAGDRWSKTCKVWNLVAVKISQAEDRAYFQNKNGK